MIEHDEARRIALGIAQAASSMPVAIVDSQTRIELFGWVFFYHAAMSPHSLIGNAPIIVDRQSGRASVTGTSYPIDWFIHAYGSLGQERFDAREWISFIEREYLSKEVDE